MPEGQAEGQTDLWTQFLDFISRFVIPDWAELVQLIPLGLLAIAFLGLGLTAYRWWAAAGINRSRVARPIPAAQPPPGVHLPGPSLWPFVVPIAATFLLFALVFEQNGIPNLTLIGIGLLVLVVGLAGWLRDANREWRRAETGGEHGPAGTHEITTAHGLPGGVAATPALGPGSVVGPALSPSARALSPMGGAQTAVGGVGEVAAPPLEPPPGVHLPGPSPWPFFAPIALTFVLFGMVFGAALIVGGLVMGVIAAIGWYRDANYELREVEVAGHAEPRTRDPERAFPKGLAAVYVLVGVLSLTIVAGPAIASRLRGGGADGGAGGGPPVSAEHTVTAQNLAFDTSELNVPAGQPITITFTNNETAPHNIAIYDSSERTTEIFNGKIIEGPDVTEVYNVDPLDAGNYYFLCIVHPNMNGTVNAQ